MKLHASTSRGHKPRSGKIRWNFSTYRKFQSRVIVAGTVNSTGAKTEEDGLKIINVLLRLD